MRTHSQAEDLSSIRAEQSYGIRVRSGNLALDKLIYELAYTEFGRHLPVSESGQYTGFLDIVFTSISGSTFRGPVAGFTANMAYGNNWFTGDDASWISGGSAYPEKEIAPGGIFSWQESTMIVTIRDIENRRLWKADFNYKGGRDLTGLYIKTADEAARFCLNKIIEEFEIEYVLDTRATRNKTGMTMSSDNTVLILKSRKSPLQEPPVYRAKWIPPDITSIVKSPEPLPRELPVYKANGIMPKAPIAFKGRKILFRKAPPLRGKGYLER